MKSEDQIVESIALRIGQIYFRPLMYGGKAFGVEALLHAYHDLWAEIFDCRETFHSALSKVTTLHVLNDEKLTEDEKAVFVVERWRKVSKKLKVPVPYKLLREHFKDNETLKAKFPEEK